LSKGGDDECDERGMIVLLVKHVHLQKEGGAKGRQLCLNLGFGISCTQRYLQAANVDIMSAQIAKSKVSRVIA
jgi:hypothetical protein